MTHLRRLLSFAAGTALVFGAAGAVLPSAAQAGSGAHPASRTAAQAAGAGARPAACARAMGPRRERCYLLLQPATARAAVRPASCAVNEAAGYTPCNIQSAYGLTTASLNQGKGSTVAIVDAYDDPNAESDLAFYRSTYGLPACTASPCFKKVNQLGQQRNYPTPNASFAQETSLDLDMVSAICPNCHILLVEANSNGLGDLGAGVAEAVKLKARVVSDSWGSGEFNGETGYDGDFDQPGVAITFSSGDGAYVGGVQYPTASPYVTSVGGTELTPASNTRGWTESTWVTPGSPPTQGSGSGCSAYEPKPGWQKDTGCTNRTTADVSAVAANVLGYDTYSGSGWYYFFGTSVSSPVIAGIYGLDHNPANSSIPASAAYSAKSSSRYDITTGSTGTCTPTYLCTAGTGYDGPTGLGSPHGTSMFKVPAGSAPSISGVSFSGSPASPVITVTGSNFGSYPPFGTPENCQAGDTGDDYGPSGLYFSDSTQGWAAGQAGDCIGLILSSWSSTQAVYTFGNQYSNYSPVASGDQVTVGVQGATFTGPLQP